MRRRIEARLTAQLHPPGQVDTDSPLSGRLLGLSDDEIERRCEQGMIRMGFTRVQK